MFEYLYTWFRDVAYYLILVTAVVYVLPTNSYRKYIRFFTGLVLVLMVLTPVLNLFGSEIFVMEELFETYELEYERNIPELVSDMKSIQIEVEDIVIGP